MARNKYLFSVIKMNYTRKSFLNQPANEHAQKGHLSGIYLLKISTIIKVGAHYLCLGFDWCRQTLKQEPREIAMAVASP